MPQADMKNGPKADPAQPTRELGRNWSNERGRDPRQMPLLPSSPLLINWK